MTPKDLPKEFPHGTRARYVAMKCRCDDCRKANTEYAKRRDHERAALAKERANPPIFKMMERRVFGRPPELVKRRVCAGIDGHPCPEDAFLRSDSKGDICGTCRKKLDWNGLVQAEPARAHMKMLSKQGMGMKSVADVCDISETIIAKIWNGTKKQIRANTAQRILGVTIDSASDGNRIDARPTWKLIHKLQKMGVTKRELSNHLGLAEGSVYLYTERKKVTVKRAHQVKKFYEEKVQELAAAKAIEAKMAAQEICFECGLSHHKEDRKKLIARMLPCKASEIADAYQHIYPTKVSMRGHQELSRTLVRDLHEIGATQTSFIWHLPEPTESRASSG